MHKSTLIVDDDEARRRGLTMALSRMGLRYLDVADAFGAMAALGRADFGAVIATEGRRTLSLRGLCQLARRRHPNVGIFVIHRAGSDPRQIPEVLGTHVELVDPTTPLDAVAQQIESFLAGPPTTVETPFVAVPATSEALAVFDEDPTIKVPVSRQVPVTPSSQPTSPGMAAASMPSLGPDEVTERMERYTPPSSSPLPSPTLELPIAGVPMADRPVSRDPEVTERTPLAPSAITLPPLPPSLRDAAPTIRMPISGPALLEGVLDGGSGPGLLMGLFAQELTGRLLIQGGPASATLYIYRGEPVWADDPNGDQGLHRRLVQKGKLPPNAALEPVAEGQLLASLVQKGVLSGEAMHEFMRELVRDVVLSIATAATGGYRFDEDKSFLDVAPLLRVNPFGLILEARRRAVSPAELMAMAQEIGDKYVVPAPGLQKSADKLAPFVRGARLGHVIDGTRTVKQLLEYASLDAFMGTLVVASLVDSRLVSLSDTPRERDEGGVTLTDDLPFLDEDVEVTVVDTETPAAPASSVEEERAREEIFQLYMRLKPLTLPRAVLGVSVDADLAEIEQAFRERMAQLDPARVPEGSAQAMLTARIDELRRKVTSAYQALRLQVSSGTNVTAFDKSKTNPF